VPTRRVGDLGKHVARAVDLTRGKLVVESGDPEDREVVNDDAAAPARSPAARALAASSAARTISMARSPCCPVSASLRLTSPAGNPRALWMALR
jgi:hypothetical protein